MRKSPIYRVFRGVDIFDFLMKLMKMMNYNKETELKHMKDKIRNLELKKWYSYKELCEVLSDKPKTNKTKKKHIAEIARYSKLAKVGNSYMVSEYYDDPLPYEKVEHLLPEFENLNQTDYALNFELQKEMNNIKSHNNIKRIDSKRYWWKCLKCNAFIYASPKERLKEPYSLSNKETICNCCNSYKNAAKIFRFLGDKGIMFLSEYSFDDLKGLKGGLLRFDFAILDENENLKALIEYDGEYHDKDLNPLRENYEIIFAHDKLKNNYCKEKEIPLLRIHHTKSYNFEKAIYDFFDSIGMDNYADSKREKAIIKEYEDIISTIQSFETFSSKDYDTICKINYLLRNRNENQIDLNSLKTKWK